MGSIEPARHALYSRLQEVLGAEHADTLMNSLPLEPVARLATKDDIDRLEARIDRLEDRIDHLETRIDALGDELRGFNGVLREQLRSYTVTMVTAMTALTGIYAGLLVVLR